MNFVFKKGGFNTKTTKGRHKGHQEESRSMNENELANKVIGLSIDIHRSLGPGLLENAYEECLYFKLLQAGFKVEKQKPMPLVYEEVKLECGYRIDLVVENKLVVEVKSVDAIHPIHLAQTLTYLRIGDYRLGLLINFNVELLRDGIKRLINGNL